MNKTLPWLFLFFSLVLQAQEMEYTASINVQGIHFSEESAPFWLYSNQRGRVNENTNISGWVNGTARYIINSYKSFMGGIGAYYQDGFDDHYQLDEYFLNFQNKRISAFIGKMHRKELYSGLSATNENILWSLNSEPMPGVGFEITEPVVIWKAGGLGFKASWEEYLLEEVRYVDHVKVHHKSFHLVFNKIRNWELIVGLQHFAQWGGISPDYGQLPETFHDYLNVLVGKEGRDDVQGQEANALGNHLGSYEVYLNTSFSHYNVNLIYNTLFEDNSGRILGNTPDGRYGVYIEDQEKDFKLLEAAMYEFYYTRDQSKNTPTGDGKDNYFNNNLYRSGWTYQKKILGAPFFMLDDERFRVEHNSIRVHHFGLKGTLAYLYPYKFLISFRENYGAKGGTDKPQEQIISTFLNMKLWEDIVDVELLFGADIDLNEASNLGVGIRLGKQF